MFIYCLLTAFKKYMNIVLSLPTKLMNQETITKKNIISNNLGDIHNSISLETELSESLYLNMKDFVLKNPKWDQYQLINSAIASFLVQNGCGDSKVTELYLNQLFNP